jgi:hypothetical protein
VTTPEELDKVMKKVGPAMQASTKAMAGPNYAEVKAQMAIVKQGVLDSQQFWIEHKKEDALKFNKETLAKLDDFDKLIATDTVDTAAAAASLKAVGAACRQCGRRRARPAPVDPHVGHARGHRAPRLRRRGRPDDGAHRGGGDAARAVRDRPRNDPGRAAQRPRLRRDQLVTGGAGSAQGEHTASVTLDSRNAARREWVGG